MGSFDYLNLVQKILNVANIKILHCCYRFNGKFDFFYIQKAFEPNFKNQIVLNSAQTMLARSVYLFIFYLKTYSSLLNLFIKLPKPILR